jgi:hypothetical protein
MSVVLTAFRVTIRMSRLAGRIPTTGRRRLSGSGHMARRLPVAFCRRLSQPKGERKRLQKPRNGPTQRRSGSSILDAPRGFTWITSFRCGTGFSPRFIPLRTSNTSRHKRISPRRTMWIPFLSGTILVVCYLSIAVMYPLSRRVPFPGF